MSDPKMKCLLVTSGFEHSVALFENGDVYSWGFGASGCLGHGNYTTLDTPKKVEIPGSCYYIQAGGYHNAAIL